MSDVPVEERDKQLIITLALMQKTLEDVVVTTHTHHIALFGNGNPQLSIMWTLKELSETVQRINEKCELKTATDTQECLTWSQTLKKILVKAPYVIAIIGSVALLSQPTTDLLSIFLKLLTK